MGRATVRAALGTALASSGFTTIYTYAPLDLLGASKVLTIYSDKSSEDCISKGMANNFYHFFLDVYVKRASGVNTENDLDTLHDAIATMVKANPRTANWSAIELGESDAFFAEVAGIPYRCERHPIKIKVTS